MEFADVTGELRRRRLRAGGVSTSYLFLMMSSDPAARQPRIWNGSLITATVFIRDTGVLRNVYTTTVNSTFGWFTIPACCWILLYNGDRVQVEFLMVPPRWNMFTCLLHFFR
jgi:hypothetical protein